MTAFDQSFKEEERVKTVASLNAGASGFAQDWHF